MRLKLQSQRPSQGGAGLQQQAESLALSHPYPEHLSDLLAAPSSQGGPMLLVPRLPVRTLLPSKVW